MSEKQETLTQDEIDQIAGAITIGDISRKEKKKGKTAPQVEYDAFNMAEEIKSKLGEKIKETGNEYHPFDFSDISELEKQNIFRDCVKARNEYLKSLQQKSKPKNYNPFTAIESAYDMYEKAMHFCSDFGKKRTLVQRAQALESILKEHKDKGKINLILPIASFILALFFSALNFTGGVTGTAKQDFSILGILFFIAGLIFVFVYARSRR